MQNKIKNLKQIIEENKEELHAKYKGNCQLLEPILNMLDLLILYNAKDERIEEYLNNMNSSIKIIQEKIEWINKSKT